MNPIIILILLVFFTFTVWVGRSGALSVRVFFKKQSRNFVGAALLLLAAFMVSRGFLEPAFIPAALGFWLIAAKGGENPIIDILEQYLDRRFPGWAAHFKRNSHTRRGGMAQNGCGMSEEEAYKILGLEFGATRQAINNAYRQAIKKVHPDQGGAAELAVQLNIARDVLLRRHV